MILHHANSTTDNIAIIVGLIILALGTAFFFWKLYEVSSPGEKEPEKDPEWTLDITPGLIRDREETINGVTVTFDKTCWSWNIIREDLRGKGGSWWWDYGATDTQEEAVKIGLKKLELAKKQHASKNRLGEI